MNTNSFFKKAVITLAILLTTTAGALAQTSGTYTLTNGQNYNSDIVLTGNVTYEVISGTATISGKISGSFSVTKSGGGTLILTAENTYSGSTTVSAGTLQIGDGVSTVANLLNTTSVSVATNAILCFNINTSNNLTFAKSIGGGGSVVKRGIGTLTLSGSNSYSDFTDIYEGTVWFNSANSFGTSQIYFCGAGQKGLVWNTGNTADISSRIFFSGNTSASYTTLNIQSNNVTFASAFNGSPTVGTLAKAGTGTLTITANNTYGGTWSVLDGTLQIGNGTSTTASIESASGVSITSGATLRFQPASTGMTFSKVISGDGNVEKAGTAKLTLTGANTYGGATTVSNGTLQIGNGTSGSIANTSSVTLSSTSSVLRFEPGAIMIFAPQITGAGKVEYSGVAYTKSLYLTSNDNSYTGGTSVLAGDLCIGHGGSTGVLPGNVSVATGATLFFVRKGDMTFGGIISGGGSVCITDCDKVTLTGANTFTGRVEVVSGSTLQVGNGTSGTISTSSSATIFPSCTLRFEPGANMVFDKVISGGGNVEYKGSTTKTLTFTANNTYSGTTTIEESSDFYIGNNTNTGDVGGNIINNGYLNFKRNNIYNYSGVISGSGSVYINIDNTGGTVTFNGANTYTGETMLFGGTFILGATGKIENSTSVYLYHDNAKFSISGSKKIKGLASSTVPNAEVNLGSNRLTIGTDGESDGGGTYTGKIVGTGGITKRGTGTLFLSGATGTYSGWTDFFEGAIVFSAANNLGTGSLYFCGSGTKTLCWAAGNTADMSARVGFDAHNGAANAILDIGANDVTFASDFDYYNTPSGKLTKAGSGKLTITAANTYPAAIEIAEGTLQIGNGTTGSMENITGVSISNGATLRFEPDANTVFDKVISGAGKVEFKGPASRRLAFTGNNTYTGTTTIDGGELLIGGALGAPGTTGAIVGNIIVNNNPPVEGWLTFNRSDEYTCSGIVSGSGIVHKAGGGKTVLTGANTYQGKTYMSGGTLQVGNGLSGSINTTSNVEIDASSAILRFEPGTSYAFTKNITGSGKVEYKGVGTYIEFTGTNTYDGTTTIEQGTFYVGNGTAAGSIKGNIIVNANAKVSFDHNVDHQYTGVISGAGNVENFSAGGILTFTGAHTYGGNTIIAGGALALSATGTIANSNLVNLGVPNVKFDVSTGDKKIKALSAVNNTEVILGTSTLTIGVSGEANGGGDFKGKFTGTTGAVTKTGTETFSVSGTAHTVTGNFNQNGGSVKFAGNWLGKYVKSTAGNLDIIGDVSFGSLDLYGGNISMDLTAATPSKINVTGNVTASGVTNLNLTAPEITPPAYKVLISSGGGITSTAPFSVTPSTCTLGGNFPFELWLTSNIPNAIEEVVLPELKIYPNPTKGELIIDNGQLTIDNVEIYDIFGKKIVNCQLSIVNSIDISHLPNGIYFVKIANKTVKIIKN